MMNSVVAQPQFTTQVLFTLEDLIQAQGLDEAHIHWWHKVLMNAGRFPFRQPFIAVEQYSEGEHIDLPLQLANGYSAIAVRLQTQSPVSLDNVPLRSDYVFAAATHDMRVEFGTPAKVAYESPVKMRQGKAYFASALIMPVGGELKLKVTGNKKVHELRVLNSRTLEYVSSPDLVILGDETRRYDIGEVTIRTTTAVTIMPSDSPAGVAFGLPFVLGGAACYAARKA